MGHQQANPITVLSGRNSLVLMNQTATRAPGGQIQIKTTLENSLAHGTLWADVQYVFFDAKGQPIEKSEWVSLQFPPREIVLMSGNSLRADAKSFNVQFKNMRSGSGEMPTASGWAFGTCVSFDSILLSQ